MKKKPPRIFQNAWNEFYSGEGKYNVKYRKWESKILTTKGIELQTTIEDNHLNTLATRKLSYWPSDT